MSDLTDLIARAERGGALGQTRCWMSRREAPDSAQNTARVFIGYGERMAHELLTRLVAVQEELEEVRRICEEVSDYVRSRLNYSEVRGFVAVDFGTLSDGRAIIARLDYAAHGDAARAEQEEE
jgi:hypothetical protein